MLTASQIYSKIDRALGTTSTSYPLADKSVDVNLAQNEVLYLALKNGGWNVDDFNHTDDPFITQNIVSGQRNYYFTKDEDSNYIVGIRRVMAKDSGGIFQDLTPVDQQTPGDTITLVDGQNSSGTPTKYDKTGNGIFLDLVPNYNSTGGLKIFIDREMTYFASGDTTKVSGIDPLCHDYLYLKPAYEYARDKGLQVADRLFRDLQIAQAKVEKRYGSREQDINRKMVANVEDCE